MLISIIWATGTDSVSLISCDRSNLIFPKCVPIWSETAKLGNTKWTAANLSGQCSREGWFYGHKNPILQLKQEREMTDFILEHPYLVWDVVKKDPEKLPELWAPQPGQSRHLAWYSRFTKSTLIKYFLLASSQLEVIINQQMAQKVGERPIIT